MYGTERESGGGPNPPERTEGTFPGGAGRARGSFPLPLKISFVVGTALTLANQGIALAAGAFCRPMLLSVLLNYLVPFLVASYVENLYRRKPENTGGPQHAGE